MDKALILARGLGTRMRQDSPQVKLCPTQERIAAAEPRPPFAGDPAR